jgi:predicted transcriptional regulator
MVSFDYSQLPIVTKQRDLVGYVTLKNLQNNLQSGKVTTSSTLDKVMYPFKKNINYELITLDTLLIDLDRFFNKRNTVAFITDDQLKFCIGVVTQFDLDLFLGKRSRLNEFN